MKYNKIFITSLVILLIGSIYAQDNIINEIATGGKFIVRDEEQNEAMVIEDGNVGVMGTLKLEVLPKGEIGNTVVVWDPVDKLLKLQVQNLGAGSSANFNSDSWNNSNYDSISEITTTISASVQGNDKSIWKEANNKKDIFRKDGNVGIGTDTPEGVLDLNSTSGALIVPRMTIGQRDNLPTINGSIIYNITSNEFNFLQDGTWKHF